MHNLSKKAFNYIQNNTNTREEKAEVSSHIRQGSSCTMNKKER